VLFLIVFIDLVGFGMIIPMLPLYAEAYSPSPWQFAALMAAFSLMQFLFNPILGRLSDRFGRRPVLLLSLVGAASGYFLLAIANSLLLLFISRIVAGIFAANISTAQAVAADITGPEGRAKSMGILGAAFGLGFIAGPAIGGVLDAVAPWLPGAFACGTSLLAFVLTIFLLPETRWQGEATQSRPRVQKAALEELRLHPALYFCFATLFLGIVAFSTFEVTFAQYLARTFEFDPLTERSRIYPFFVYAGVLGALVQGGLVGRVSKRFGPSRVIVAGFAFSSLALFVLPLAVSVLHVLGVLAILAVGQGLASPSLSALTSTLVPRDHVGAVMGLYQSVSSLGRIIGPVAGQLTLAIGDAAPLRLAGSLQALGVLLAFGILWRIRRSEDQAGSRGTSA
jgi:multidrug resistance protein